MWGSLVQDARLSQANIRAGVEESDVHAWARVGLTCRERMRRGVQGNMPMNVLVNTSTFCWLHSDFYKKA